MAKSKHQTKPDRCFFTRDGIYDICGNLIPKKYRPKFKKNDNRTTKRLQKKAKAV